MRVGKPITERRIVAACFFLALCIFVNHSIAGGFTWPDGKESVVVLTYDDTLESHLSTVIPQLDEAGLLGTFYITVGRGQLLERMDEWRAAAAKGHELGNHTLFHPCQKSGVDSSDWIPDYYDMDKYTLEQFDEELRLANITLNAIDGKTRRTFAYTCGHFEVGGGISIRPAVQNHVTAARVGNPPFNAFPEGVPTSVFNGVDHPATMDRYEIASVNAAFMSGAQLVAAAEEVKSTGGVVTFLFHGVADEGEYLTVGIQAHQVLVDYLRSNQQVYWVAPLQDVIDHIDGEIKKAEDTQ